MWDSEMYDTDHGRQIPHTQRDDDAGQDSTPHDTYGDKSDDIYKESDSRGEVYDEYQHEEEAVSSHEDDDDSHSDSDASYDETVARGNAEILENIIEENLRAKLRQLHEHPRVAERCLEITEREREFIPEDLLDLGDWDILCKLITLVAGTAPPPETETDENNDLSEMLTNIRLDEQGQMSEIMETLQIPESSEDKMTEMMEALHLPTNDQSNSAGSANAEGIDWWRISSLYNWYGSRQHRVHQTNQFQTWVMDKLHQIRMHNNLDEIFDTETGKALQRWDTPLVNCSTFGGSWKRDFGVHECKYIPFISLMIRRQMMLGIITATNWAVLFHTDPAPNITMPFTADTLNAIAESYAKVGPEIDKVIIVLSIETETPNSTNPRENDLEHILCVLIMRSAPEPFITLMDVGWIGEEFQSWNQHYIARMLQIARAIGMNPVTIMLSHEACKWREDEINRMKQMDEDEDGTSFFRAVRFLDSNQAKAQGLEWLDDMLNDMIDFETTPHSSNRIWERLYTPVLYITSCINERGINSEVNIPDAVDEMQRAMLKINCELTSRILANECLLSPASVQFALQRTDVEESLFYSIDGADRPPSDTYAWAVSSGRGGVRVHALKHDLRMFKNEFHWTEEDYTVHPNASKAFLHQLRARANNNTASSRKRNWQRERRADEMEVENGTRQRTRR